MIGQTISHYLLIEKLGGGGNCWLIFTTGPQTRLIAIKVMRVLGNPLIKGTFWLDDVRLTPVAPVEVGRESVG